MVHRSGMKVQQRQQRSAWRAVICTAVRDSWLDTPHWFS
jgi:hypothetical protein